MAKFAAYLGPPTQVATLVERGTHSLVRQSAEQPDGFGIGWYPDDDQPEPLSVSSVLPIWSEDIILKVARRYASSSFICGLRKLRAEDRDAPPLIQPFQWNRHLFFHDGELSRFKEVFERPLRSQLGDIGHGMLKTSSASELLFATWADALSGSTSADASANALETMANRVRDIALGADAPATFGVVVLDGRSIVTLRTATHGTPPPMYTIVAGEGTPVPPLGRVIASEPLFPGAWSSLDPHSMVIFSADEQA